MLSKRQKELLNNILSERLEEISNLCKISAVNCNKQDLADLLEEAEEIKGIIEVIK